MKSDFYRDTPVLWQMSVRPVPYPVALERMAFLSQELLSGDGSEYVWLLEHPPLYTAGSSARSVDLLDPGRFAVYEAGRGGQYTYHGPGQRVVYLILDLSRRRRDLRAFIQTLELWLIRVLEQFGIRGEVRPGRIGIWVSSSEGETEEKIAAIGIRLRRWITSHGLSLNVHPDLSHFRGIVPCGLRSYGITSLQALGSSASLAQIDVALRREFEILFGPTKSSDFDEDLS